MSMSMDHVLRVAYQGVKGAYSEAAIFELFGCVAWGTLFVREISSNPTPAVCTACGSLYKYKRVIQVQAACTPEGTLWVPHTGLFRRGPPYATAPHTQDGPSGLFFSLKLLSINAL